MRLTEYEPGTAFPGVIGRTTDASSPAWPRPPRAAPGSPNVVVIVLDDTVGFFAAPCVLNRPHAHITDTVSEMRMTMARQ